MIQKSTTAPMFIYGTRHGSFYNLTPTNLPKTIPAIQLCYGDFHDYLETIKNLPQGMSFKKFLGFSENVLTYLTPYDFSKSDCMAGCQHQTKVKIKCNKGYTQVTTQMYDTMIQTLNPDLFVTLTQYPSLQKNHEQNTNKSLKRAINKTKSYLELSKYTRDQQNDHNKKEGVAGPVRLAALHGGTNLSLVCRSLEQILNYAVDGIVVCDLCFGESLEQREEVYRTVLQRLDQEYARENSYFKDKRLKLVLAGQGKLADIEHALNFGFQAFQINYPFSTAQSQKALILNTQTNQILQKTPVLSQTLQPLDPNCKCHTCQNHNESYIAHLIDCYELTGKILLSIHNVFVYQDWLDRYRKSHGII